jgi:hypothetical protein
VNIVNSAAPHATQMVVPGDVAIETGLDARKFQFSDDASPSQQLQIPVNGAQTDFVDPPTDNFVKRNGRGMRLELLQLLQDDLSLPSTALNWFRFHRPLTLLLLVIITDNT